MRNTENLSRKECKEIRKEHENACFQFDMNCRIVKFSKELYKFAQNFAEKFKHKGHKVYKAFTKEHQNIHSQFLTSWVLKMWVFKRNSSFFLNKIKTLSIPHNLSRIR